MIGVAQALDLLVRAEEERDAARAEIARLRAEVDEVERQRDTMYLEREALRAEVERLTREREGR